MTCRKWLVVAVLFLGVTGFAQQHPTRRVRGGQDRQTLRHQKRVQNSAHAQRVPMVAPGLGSARVTPSVFPALTGSNPSPFRIGLLAAERLDMGGINYWSEMVAGDFNGDGKMDFANDVAAYQNGNWWHYLAVALGNGDGTFQEAKLTALTDVARYLAAADLNHDGTADIVTVDDTQVYVYTSNGDGTFTAFGSYAPPGANSPLGLVLADVNGDGKLDIVESNVANVAFTLLGNGDGTFQAATAIPFGVVLAPFPTAIGDLNGDAKPEIVGFDQTTGELVVLTAAEGGYTKAAYAIPGGNYESATLGDLNGDGKLDVAVSTGNADIIVYLNTGNGSLASGVSHWAGIASSDCAIGDFNGDGKADIAAVDLSSAGINILLNQGNGAFSTPAFGSAVGGWPSIRPAVADFNSDGKADVVLFDNDTESALYLPGDGDGSFRAAVNYYGSDPSGQNSPYYGYSVATGDFNGDARPDIVVSTDIGITVFLAKPGGGYNPGVHYNTGYELDYVAVADFNGDGKLDVAATDFTNSAVQIFTGNGDGTFADPTPHITYDSTSYGEPEGIVVRDFNGDNRPDIAVLNYGDVGVLLNNGSGFGAPVAYPVSGDGYVLAAGDVNGDGKLDLVASGGSNNTISVLRGNGDGTFQTAESTTVNTTWNGNYVFAPYGVAVGDFNGDSKADVALTYTNYTDGTSQGAYLGVLISQGDGTFDPVVVYPATTITDPSLDLPQPSDIVAADFNQDGKLDLIYTNMEFGRVAIMYGKGDGTFYDPLEFAATAGVEGLTAADLNSDGSLDIAVTGYYFAGATVMENAGGNRMTLATSGTPTDPGQSVTFTATVTPSAHGVIAVPGGTITFKDGSTTLGTGTLASGVATLTLTTLTAGTHTITANFAGDTNFVPNTASTSHVVTAPDFTFAADSTSKTVNAGGTAIFNLSVTPSGGFSAGVNFSCATGLARGTSCAFDPPSVTPGGSAAATVLRVQTTAKSGTERAITAGLHGAFWTTFGTLGLLGCVLLTSGKLLGKTRKSVVTMLMTLALLSIALLVGCGGGRNGGGGIDNSTPKGTMTITVNAVSGSTTKSLNLSVTVQ